MRQRLRHLHLDGTDYTWTAVIGTTTVGGRRVRSVRVRVWGDGKTGRALQADLLPKTADVGYAIPASGEVRKLVEYGLANGWDPGARGGTFTVAGVNLQLPGFEVTVRAT